MVSCKTRKVMKRGWKKKAKMDHMRYMREHGEEKRIKLSKNSKVKSK